MSTFFDISPKLSKDLGMGNFLTPPDDGTVTLKPSNDPDTPIKSWKETLNVVAITPKDYDGTNVIQVRFSIPADVVSSNQGRVVFHGFRFPWQPREEGQRWAEIQMEINYKALRDFCCAAGYDGELTGTIDRLAPWDDLINMRVSCTYELKPDKDQVVRQDLKYFKTPQA